ncbi:NADH-ubiquinone oxidoreductase-F iron-sulfur binding region domain-containing protein [Paractinoplanes globisporus]|uniref:NADH-ubiquinone oxidoreductase-F iron-sulfur binding region domain-containing protein n=1 Tax=Paractinoplanes globisporus TaxID=113565 RepID=A0ABW6W953_9ACTN|nr:NADH-ubiquinone oxidoreductase-F iron-sulfur binding region domain-containing protein [Actinoplanes globisporus]
MTPSPSEIIELAAGLRGRGGAGFPTATKLASVRRAAAPRTVVANGEEGEPGSLKDRWLLRERPELVLEGLRLAAVAIEADRSVVYFSDQAAEQSVIRLAPPTVEIIRVAPRYVAGEETSIVRVLDGGPALPLAKPPRPYEQGVLVLNVESLARLARRAAGESDPPLLATLTGGGRPATLHEVHPGTTLRALTEAHTPDPVRGVLAGGLFGGFLTTLDVEVSHDGLAAAGSALGCGAFRVLGPDDCPVAVAAAALDYLAGQSAQQCGACIRGTDALSATVAALRAGTATAADLDLLATRASRLPGRGACGLPDAAARLATSLLTVFPAVVRRHLIPGCEACRLPVDLHATSTSAPPQPARRLDQHTTSTSAPPQPARHLDQHTTPTSPPPRPARDLDQHAIEGVRA